MEGSSDLWCHLDHQASLFLDLLIAFLNPVLHPAGEHALEDGGAHVTDPFLRDLMYLLGVWHVVPYVLVSVVQEERDVLQRQALVLGHRYVTDVLRLDAWRNR